jgi:ELWxxDGT repeat protein
MLARQRGCTPGLATGVVQALEQRTLLDASLLRDVNTVMEPISVPADFIDLNGVLLFHTRIDRGMGLFRSDGTAAGTAQIATLDVGTFDASGVFGGVLYFGASDAAAGQELWKTDGTAAGTVRVKDIYPGPRPSSPRLFRVAGGRLLFVATDAFTASAFWTTDGTEAGTVLTYAADRFFSQSGIDGVSAVGQSLYFSTSTLGIGSTVWESDAAFGNVRRLRDFPYDNDYRADSFTPAGDRVVFRAYSRTYGTNLWSTDGTPEGTLPIRGGRGADERPRRGGVAGRRADGVLQRLHRGDGRRAVEN